MNDPEAQDDDDVIEDAEDFDIASLIPDLASGCAPDLAPLALTVGIEHRGTRLDKVLSHTLPQFSRSRLQQWIEEGRVSVDGKPCGVRQIVLGEERIVVSPQPDPSSMSFVPEPIPMAIVHEDDALIVIDKPVGMVVHPAAGNWTGTLLNGLLHRWPALQGVPRAGIVHRLDKDTTGLLVVAKTLSAQTSLVRQLQDRSMSRQYLALVWGQPVSGGRIEAAIARHPRERTRMAVSQSILAKPAVTHYTRLASGVLDGKPVSLLRCRLETGRTHQIRVHLQSIGFALVGDGVYGKPHLSALFPRQALHAERLGLVHPSTGELCEWHAPLPEDMAALLERSGMVH
ncbi:MAG: RluA family pseudouridine synthase [Betaproteobacteria bacterium]|nr:RluA family pseudouridine synthase [Betaproteobacteria bacterium]